MDKECDGDLSDSASGEGTFQSDSNTYQESLSEIDSSQQWCFEAQVEVDGVIVGESSDGVCSTDMNVSKQSPDCGDGVCDEGERCEFTGSGEITCPDLEALTQGTCRPGFCTYCGDGILDADEVCEPSLNPDCNDDCTLPGLPATAAVDVETALVFILGLLFVLLAVLVYQTGFISNFIVNGVDELLYKFPPSLQFLRDEYESRILNKIEEQQIDRNSDNKPETL